MCPKICQTIRAGSRKALRCKEAPVGIEPTNRGFADLCLTTWLRRRKKRKLATHYEFGKSWRSNPGTGVAPGGENGDTPMGIVVASPLLPQLFLLSA